MTSRIWRVALSFVSVVALALSGGLGSSPANARAATVISWLGRGPTPAPAAGADSLSSRDGQTQDQLDKNFLDAWVLQRRVDPGAPAGGAKVLVVKYNDWMCPGCKAAHETFKPILEKYQATPGALKYVEKDWPWNARCNSAANQTFPGHESSCEAAAAVRLASDRGKRDLMVTWLFANQGGMTPEKVKAKATEMLGLKDFAAAYVLKLPEIRKDVTDGQAVDIRSTPTYFVNGIRAGDEQGRTLPPHYFELAIQYELRKNGGK